MSGWFKAPVADWPVVAELLPRPWPIEAVRIDLAYLADRSKIQGEEIPGGRELGTRWGWGHKKVRLLLDKIKTVNLGAQLGHKKGTKEAHYEELEAEQSETKGHKKGTKRAQEGHTSNILYTETETDTEEKEKVKKEKDLPDCEPNQPVAQAAQGQAPFLEHNEEQKGFSHLPSPQSDSSNSEKNGVEPHTQRRTEPVGMAPPTGPRSNSRQTHDDSVYDAYLYKDTENTQNERIARQDENDRHPGVGQVVQYRRQLQGTEGLNPTQSKENKAFEVDDYALFVKHWMSRSPGAIPVFSSKPAQYVRDCIRRRGLQACIDVIDWSHDSSHPTAVFLHEKGNVTFNALFKPEKEADYVNLAATWVASGKKSQAPKPPNNPFDIESKWEGSRDIDFSQYEPLENEIGEAFEKLF